MDKNITGLEERIDHRHSEVRKMEVQWQKQQVMTQDLMTKVGALEARETDWEIQIAVQEDTIQILSAEVEELKGKMCCCNESPCIVGGSGQAESPYELSKEEGSLGSLYLLVPVTLEEGSLIPI